MKVYTRNKKRKEKLRFTSSTIIGILLSIILSIILCLIGIKSILWIIPQVHIILRYVFDYFVPNILPKETNLKETLIFFCTILCKVSTYLANICSDLVYKSLDLLHNYAHFKKTTCYSSM